jgi:hypothetical protein
MSRPILPSQAKALSQILPGGIPDDLSFDQAQSLIQRPKELQRQIAELLRGAQWVNPHADKIVRPAWDYPPEWQGMKSWEEQIAALYSLPPFSGLNPDGLPEMAKSYLEQEELWSLVFKREGHSQPYPLYDGLVVYALPGKVAAKLGIGDLWADVAKDREGKGLWGKLCEEILLPQFVLPADNPRFPAFWNNIMDAMGSDRFMPLGPIAQWFQEQEAQIKGDFACRPFNFGRRLAGYAVCASCLEAENLLAGFASPVWLTAQALVTNPGRLPRSGILAIDCSDPYRFGNDRRALGAPYFYRYDSGLRLGAGRIEYQHDNFGLAFVLRQ